MQGVQQWICTAKSLASSSSLASSGITVVIVIVIAIVTGIVVMAAEGYDRSVGGSWLSALVAVQVPLRQLCLRHGIVLAGELLQPPFLCLLAALAVLRPCKPVR